MNLPIKRFTVYAILLSPEVLTKKKFREANPDYLDGKDCLYVGMTAKDPKERFEQHRSGYKSNGYAQRFGVKLMPPEFTIINPRTFDEARRMERRIASRLRREGYGVWQN
jgi:predicted GIY-YIG superfamily endonuclease